MNQKVLKINPNRYRKKYDGRDLWINSRRKKKPEKNLRNNQRNNPSQELERFLQKTIRE